MTENSAGQRAETGGRVPRTLSRELLGPVLCSLALLSCIVLANPFVNAAFNDDWSYANVALTLARTGHMHYNAWGRPTLLFQSIWAAAFIRIFGFSFNLLRAITLPFSLGFAWVTYCLGREIGLDRRLAAFGALMISVCPLFLPFAASFMTEPYACFFGTFCVYAAVRVAHTSRPSLRNGWLWVLIVCGILGGADRQSLWLLPFLLVPYLAWLNRTERGFVSQCAAAFFVCVVACVFVTSQFRPTDTSIDLTPRQWLSVAHTNFWPGFHDVLAIVLAAALMCLPGLLCLAPEWPRIAWRVLAGMTAVCILAFDYLRSGLGLPTGIAPFIGNIMSPHGLMENTAGLGTRPEVWPLGVRYGVTVALLFCIASWCYLVWKGIAPVRLPVPVGVILLLSACPHLAILMSGSLVSARFDRYAVPLLPVLAICSLLPAASSAKRIPILAWVCLGVSAVYAVATTHDYFRNLAARTAALELAQQRGIPRMHIASGFEQDGWAQAQLTGQIDIKAAPIDNRQSYHRYWFLARTPSIRPDYTTYSSDASAIPKSAILTVPYRTWLPPSKQAVSVLRTADVPIP